MIQADELAEGKDIVFKEGKDITLSVLQSVLTKVAGKYQIPIAFKTDEIKAGGLLDSTKADCLVLYHPQHYSNYFHYAVSIRRQGIMAYVSINPFGSSKQEKLGKNKNKLEDEHNYYHALEQIFNEALEEGLEEEMFKAKRYQVEQNENVAFSRVNKIAPNVNKTVPTVNRATGLCPACGSVLKQNAKFCFKCGAKINQ